MAKKPAAALALDRRSEETEPHYAVLGLTAKQAAFVKYFVLNGGNATEAAALAGYEYPGPAGYGLKNSPRVCDAIARMIRREIVADGLRMAWGVVKSALTNEDARLDVRLKAAFKTIDYAEAALEREAARAGEKRPEDMSYEELQATLHEATDALNKLVDGAKPVAQGSGNDAEKMADKPATTIHNRR